MSTRLTAGRASAASSSPLPRTGPAPTAAAKWPRTRISRTLSPTAPTRPWDMWPSPAACSIANHSRPHHPQQSHLLYR
jgi:hypothetical protein